MNRAPLARLRFRKTHTRQKPRTQSGPWSPAEPPASAELVEEEAAAESAIPHFYPFPLRSADD